MKKMNFVYFNGFLYFKEKSNALFALLQIINKMNTPIKRNNYNCQYTNYNS